MYNEFRCKYYCDECMVESGGGTYIGNKLLCDACHKKWQLVNYPPRNYVKDKQEKAMSKQDGETIVRLGIENKELLESVTNLNCELYAKNAVIKELRDIIADKDPVHSTIPNFRFELHIPCPNCGSVKTEETGVPYVHMGNHTQWKCNECNNLWGVM